MGRASAHGAQPCGPHRMCCGEDLVETLALGPGSMCHRCRTEVRDAHCWEGGSPEPELRLRFADWKPKQLLHMVRPRGRLQGCPEEGHDDFKEGVSLESGQMGCRPEGGQLGPRGLREDRADTAEGAQI